jgi:2-polyprenyl-3-methyl-5-hydroxy-6-metoxy-1,4-benzoquinol methylase
MIAMSSDGSTEASLSAADANRVYYATRAADYDKTEECVTLKQHRRRLLRVLETAIGSAQSHDRILDACGGSGYVSLELGMMGLAVTTVDISPEMLEVYVVKAAAAGLTARTEEGEIESFLENNPDLWDVIIFSSALHHLDDYRAVLLIACEKLAPGGVIATIFDPISLNKLGYTIRYADYLLWMTIRHPLTLITRVCARLGSPTTRAPSVGRIAERHALHGIDDLSLAKHLQDHGMEILLHEREAQARFLMSRMILRLLARPSTFSFVLRRPIA